jgi:hypothetical protein
MKIKQPQQQDEFTNAISVTQGNRFKGTTEVESSLSNFLVGFENKRPSADLGCR